MARHIAAKWQSYGFDHVEMAKYDVLMNYPRKDLKSGVEIHRNGDVVFRSSPREKASTSFNMLIFCKNINIVFILLNS